MGKLRLLSILIIISLVSVLVLSAKSPGKVPPGKVPIDNTVLGQQFVRDGTNGVQNTKDLAEEEAEEPEDDVPDWQTGPDGTPDNCVDEYDFKEIAKRLDNRESLQDILGEMSLAEVIVQADFTCND